jgi:hypothetical protein
MVKHDLNFPDANEAFRNHGLFPTMRFQRF